MPLTFAWAYGLRRNAACTHARQLDVVDVAAAAGEDACVLDAMDARPDVPGGASDGGAHAPTSFMRSAASWTPATIEP